MDVTRCLTCGADLIPLVCGSCTAADLAAEYESMVAARKQTDERVADMRVAISMLVKALATERKWTQHYLRLWQQAAGMGGRT